MPYSRCKICRRLGVSVCGKEKCALRKRPYPPGQKGKRRFSGLSEYGRELKEKQKLKYLYNLKEAQFRKYVKDVLGLRGKTKEDVVQVFIRTLENRLDNVVFRLGLTSSRAQARQLVSHGHFLVNGRSIDVPGFQVKKGDIIKLKPQAFNKNFFKNIAPILKKKKIPSWLSWDFNSFEAKIIGFPTLEESSPPVEISVIFEHYSR